MTTKALQLMPASLPIGSLEAYIHHVNQVPMLTKEEEISLAEQFREQEDLDAARRLVMAHLRFVVKVAKGYSGYGLSLADLIQEGNIGLMKAVKRFDPSIGVRLVSFAVHWIKSEIHEFVIRNWRIVKVATTKAQRKLFFNLRSAKKRLGWFTSDEVSNVANMLNVSEAEVLRMEQRLNAHDCAFDAPTDADDDDNYAPVYYLEDKSADPASLVEDQDWAAQSEGGLHFALQKLDARSQHILQARWLADEKMTLQALADNYQISPERIRQLEKSAFSKLKVALQD